MSARFIYGQATPESDDSGVRPPAARVHPEIVLRLADVAEIPASALGALGPLQRAGWAVTPTYCRGWRHAEGADGRPLAPKLVDSLALRCQRLVVMTVDDGAAYGLTGLARGVGIWLDGAWSVGWVGGPWVRHGYRDWLREMREWTT